MGHFLSRGRNTGRLVGARVRHWSYKVAAALRLPGIREKYWDSRAREIDATWGQAQDDFAVLAEIIRSVAPQRLLDIGCGSGRLFSLYLQEQLQEIVGQDISGEALNLARRRFPALHISLTDRPVLQLAYPAGYFDLIISNRVLQHVPHEHIDRVVDKLAELSPFVYLNETIKGDAAAETFYLFKHDYHHMFARNGFTERQRGIIGKQHWFLFSPASSLK